MAKNVVTFNEEESRYEVHADGVLAGFTQVRRRGNRSIFPHTEIFEEFRGGGVAGVLARRSLEDTAKQGRTIVPQCSFIMDYLKRHEIPGADIDWSYDRSE